LSSWRENFAKIQAYGNEWSSGFEQGLGFQWKNCRYPNCSGIHRWHEEARVSVETQIRGVARLVLRSESRADAYHEIRRRILGEPSVPAGELRRFLVICHGNICRSPYAASLLSQALPRAEVVSTGLSAAAGGPTDETALATARRRGVGLEDHQSMPTTSRHIEWADAILVMEGRHARDAARRWPSSKRKIRVLGHYLARPPFSISDPWDQPPDVFDRVFDRLEEAVSRFALLARGTININTE
jgi:protein-tyrosine phosphatase